MNAATTKHTAALLHLLNITPLNKLEKHLPQQCNLRTFVTTVKKLSEGPLNKEGEMEIRSSDSKQCG